jgi:hypothetical protein
MGLLLALGGWTCFRLMCTLGTQDQAVHRLFSFFLISSKIEEFVGLSQRILITPLQPFTR